jgi:hypothetical protein
MALDYTGIIKNNELVRGKFSLCGTNSTDPSHKEFLSKSSVAPDLRMKLYNLTCEAKSAKFNPSFLTSTANSLR